MRKQIWFFFFTAFLLAGFFTSAVEGQDFTFKSLDANVDSVEKQSLIRGTSLAADLDGEGVNNDVVLIDQQRNQVIVLVFNVNSQVPTVSIIDINSLFSSALIPTAATAFIDAQTGLQDIAISAIPATASSNSGKVIVGINDGSG